MLVASRAIFLFHWAVIAIEQEALAREARAFAVERLDTGQLPPKSEFYSAMIAIAACSHSLDALYAELAEHVAPETLAKWERARGRERWSQIAAILELAVDADVEAWRPRLRTLFQERRNPVVHPKVRLRDLVEHPGLGIDVNADEATYTVEAVEESVDLLLEILTTCADAPKPAAKVWVSDPGARGIGLRRMVEHLTDFRDSQRL